MDQHAYLPDLIASCAHYAYAAAPLNKLTWSMLGPLRKVHSCLRRGAIYYLESDEYRPSLICRGSYPSPTSHFEPWRPPAPPCRRHSLRSESLRWNRTFAEIAAEILLLGIVQIALRMVAAAQFVGSCQQELRGFVWLNIPRTRQAPLCTRKYSRYWTLQE
jgi:hypothetical protein